MLLKIDELLALVAADCASEGSQNQNMRWARRYLEFLAEVGVSFPEPDPDAACEAYRHELDRKGDLVATKAWEKRKAAINKVRKAGAVLAARNAKAAPAKHATHHVDTLTPGTRLADAVSALLTEAAARGRLGPLRSDLGRFLRYCSEASLDPTNLGPADLRRYRSRLGPSRSVNQLMTAANRLVAQLRSSP